MQSSANINGIAALAVSYYGTPGRADSLNNIFDIILVGNAHVGELIDADVATSSGTNGSVHDMPAFYLRVKDLTARRWGDAATLMASFIWSAWAEAGSPVLTGFDGNCSMSVPTEEILLKGYPVPGGFTHPDGGVPGVDAGAGGSGGGGGGNGGMGGSGGGGEEPPPPSSCGCASSGGLGLIALALLLARARRG